MNDIVEKTASSLAVVEKKPQKPGGCVGIFFQLFDWNRRLAEKKLFSKKLLPPVRFKQSSKKVAGNEKQPKLRLIADENSGGFPRNRVGSATVDIERKHETRVPGLVARLMGLESMPALHRENSKKFPPAFNSASRGKAERFVDNVCRNLKEDLNVENGEVRLELRPQKLQRTSVCEMERLNRFGSEKLPFKNVLSKSRKHHHRLPSPVKTPRNHSRKSSSKLIGAATRILEPGLCPSKLKCAITCSDNSHHSRCNDPLVEERWLSSPLQDSDGSSCVVAKEQSSCREYGQLGNRDSTPYVCKQPFIFASSLSHYVVPICKGPERGAHKQSAVHQVIEEELRQDYSTFPSPLMGHMHPCVGLLPEKNPFYGQVQQYSGSRQCKYLMGVPVSLNYVERTPYTNRMSRARSRAPSRKNLNNLASNTGSTSTTMNGTSTSLSTNERLHGSIALRITSRMDNDKFELERTASRAQTSLPPGRKRRPANNICRQTENSYFVGTSLDKQSIGLPQAMPGKQLGHNAHFINSQCNGGGGGSVHLQENMVDSRRVNNDVLSFTNSSTVTEHGTLREHAARRVQNDLDTSDSSQISSEESSRRKKVLKPTPLSGDELGALLEQKLKELTCEGKDNGGNAPKKTTATILEDLISALTSEVPLQNGLLAMPKCWDNQSPMSRSISSRSLQANAITEKQSVSLPLDSEHTSPGSVLEHYFSTESCLSDSIDDSLGYNTLNETVYDGSQSPKAFLELLDSAASKDKSSKESVVDILKNVSESLCCSDNASFGLNQDKYDYAKKVLLNAEVVFCNAFLSSSLVGRGSPIKHLLLDELEMLAGILWMKFGPTLGIYNGKEVDELKRFAFDAIIQYLNSRFGGHTAACSTFAAKLPIRMSTDALIVEVVEAVGLWKESSRFSLDELIDWEMSHSFGEWTQYETETYEEGLDMSRHLLQSLMDEIVIDLCDPLQGRIVKISGSQMEN